MANESLLAAKAAKNDEFYTQYYRQIFINSLRLFFCQLPILY